MNALHAFNKQLLHTKRLDKRPINQGDLDRAVGVARELVERGQWDGWTCALMVINPGYVYDSLVCSLRGRQELIRGVHYELLPVSEELLMKTTPDREKWRMPHLFPSIIEEDK